MTTPVLKYNIGRIFVLLFAIITSAGMMACSGELTQEDALKQIVAQDEFQSPYYAPMRIGELVLTGENHKKCQDYIRKHYGKLIDAGLVAVECSDRNTWRSVIDIQLTEKGKAMADSRRSTPKEVYVHVCRMVPVQIEEFRTLSEGNIIECTYLFAEKEVTPFGDYSGFQEGRTYKDKRTFVHARGSWRVK